MADGRLPHSLVVLLTIAAVVVLAAGVRAAAAIVNPALVAMFIAAISGPPMLWLCRHRVPQWLALLMVMAAIVLVVLLVSTLVGSSLETFTENLPAYQKRLQELSAALVQRLGQLGIPLEPAEMRRLIDLGAVMGFVGETFNTLLGALANIVLILIAVGFMLAEIGSFSHKIRTISREATATLARFTRFSASLNRYLVIKSVISLITGVLATVLLLVLGIDYPLLWGVVAFGFNYIPTVGSVIAAVPPMLLALVQYGPAEAGWVALGYLGINMLIGNVIEPRAMGRGMGLSPAVVFLSLVFWGWLLGPVGMFLSVPLTMVLKIGLDSHAETRWLAVLIGSEPEMPVVPCDDEFGPT